MKRIILSFFLCFSFSSVSAESNSANSQLLQFLGAPKSETPKEKPVEKKQKEKPKSKSKIDQEEKNLDPLLQLLSCEQKKQKKLYESDLESFNFEYIRSLKFLQDDQEFPELDEKKLTKQELAKAKKYGAAIAEGFEAPWYIRYINKQVGHGAFADDDIEAGTMVGEYTGIVIDADQADIDMCYGWSLFPPEYCRTEEKFFCVNAKKAGNFTRFINHSFYPNLSPTIVYSGGQWHMIYVAIRSIKKDEQLLVNYGAGYWCGKSCNPVEMGL